MRLDFPPTYLSPPMRRACLSYLLLIALAMAAPFVAADDGLADLVLRIDQHIAARLNRKAFSLLRRSMIESICAVSRSTWPVASRR